MRTSLAPLLFAAACSSAYADQVAVPTAPGPQIAIDVAPAKIRAPYDVQIIRENGETLPTYAQKDRFYVQGTAGERYTIRISNPTPSRVEAVVSVDGLDAIDGEGGDLHKRGYIVPPYGDVRIEGFRTSLENVATFRFSSVDGSYAGQKGKARNVGVIAVALFEEVTAPIEQQMVAPQITTTRPYRYEDDLDARASRPAGGAVGHGRVAKADDAPRAEKKAAPDSYGGGAAGAPAVTRPAPPSPPRARRNVESSSADYDGGYDEEAPAPMPANTPRTNRLGLGTEFGESRSSGASYTRFVRNAQRPIAIAELRYNDAAGLMALGIPVQPMPDSGEVMLRETADPFPGDHFSRPVR